MQPNQKTIPVAVLIVSLMVYFIAVRFMFRKDKLGFRRRWHTLDYVWVPLGGLTVVSLLALWWHSR